MGEKSPGGFCKDVDLPIGKKRVQQVMGKTAMLRYKY